MQSALSGGVLFVVNNLLAILLAARLTRWTTGSDDPLRAAVTGLANFGVVVVLLQILLGSVGALGPGWMALFLLAIHLGLSPFRGRGAIPREGAPAPSGPAPGPGRLPAALGILLLGGGLAVWLIPSLWQGTQLGWDDLVYHATIVSGWLADGRLGLEPLTYQGYFPVNAEMVSAWFMLPYRTDAFASFAAFYWALLAALAMLAIARSVTGSIVGGCAAAAMLLLASGVLALDNPQGILHTFSAVDLAGPAMFLAAVARMPHRRDGDVDRDPGAARTGLQVGLLVGFALGTKVSFAPPLLLVLAWLAWTGRGRTAGDRSVRLGRVGGCLAGIVIAGGYWYVRNLIVTGNPLFPAAVGPFDGPFAAADQARTRLIHWIGNPDFPAEEWRGILKGFLDWPWPLAALAAIGYPVAIVRLLRTRPSAVERSILGLLLAIGLVTIAAHPFTPFSGTINRPNVFPRLDQRFFLLPFAIGLMLLPMAFGRGVRAAWFSIALGIAGVAVALFLGDASQVHFALGAGGAAGLALWRWRRAVPSPFARDPGAAGGRLSRAAPIVALLIALVLVAFTYPGKLERSTRALYESQSTQGVFEALETLPDGARISMFTHLPPEYTWYDKLYGRRLQYRPVALHEDGSLQRPLHEEWRERGAWWSAWDRYKDIIQVPEFRRNLRESGTEYVIVTRPRHRKRFAYYHSHLSNMPQAVVVYKDDASLLWKLEWDD